MIPILQKTEARVFAISTLVSFTMGLTATAHAFWTDGSVTATASGTITSARYVPTPAFTSCTPPQGSPKDNVQNNFKVLVNQPAGYTLQRGGGSVGTPGNDSFIVNLYRPARSNSDNFQGTGSGSPGATLNTVMTSDWLQGVDSDWFQPNPSVKGLVWGFTPRYVDGTATNAYDDVNQGQLQVSTKIGAWRSAPLTVEYRLWLQTKSSSGFLGIGGTQSVTLVAANTGCTIVYAPAPVQPGARMGALPAVQPSAQPDVQLNEAPYSAPPSAEVADPTADSGPEITDVPQMADPEPADLSSALADDAGPEPSADSPVTD